LWLLLLLLLQVCTSYKVNSRLLRAPSPAMAKTAAAVAFAVAGVDK
jgi:hypothetical protein